MKRLAYAALSSLMIASAAIPVGATPPPTTVAQSGSTIEQMYFQQRVLSQDLETLMTQMKAMMAEMKAVTAAPSGKTITMEDLYKQQQVLAAQVETLIGRSRWDTLRPSATDTTTLQVVQQHQQAMIAEMKEMMTEMKKMVTVYRGRAGDR